MYNWLALCWSIHLVLVVNTYNYWHIAIYLQDVNHPPVKSTTRRTFLIIMSLFFSSKNGRPKLLLFIQKPSLRVMFVESRLNLGLDQRFLLPYLWQLLQEMLHRHTREILVLPIHQQRNMQVWMYYSLKKTRFCHRILEIIFNMETKRLLIPSVFCEQLSKDVVTWSNCNFNFVFSASTNDEKDNETVQKPEVGKCLQIIENLKWFCSYSLELIRGDSNWSFLVY